MDHREYMRLALELAAQAGERGDVPVGCVIVKDGQIVGRGRNRREENGDATAHAELEAIRDACARLGSWRLSGCALYVTMEPCPMCAGGIVNARIDRVYYGARDEKAGCCGSVLDMMHEKGFNHQVDVTSGVLGDECSQMMKAFFHELRAGRMQTGTGTDNQHRAVQQTFTH